MSNLRTAAKQSLEALKGLRLGMPDSVLARSLDQRIDALRAALAEPGIDPVDEYRKGFIAGQIDMRDRPEEQQEPVPEAVALKWLPAPRKTEWGSGMVSADVEIDRDHTLTLYCEEDQTAKVDAMFRRVFCKVEQPEPVQAQRGAMFRAHPAVELQRFIESAVRPACGVDPAARAYYTTPPQRPAEPEPPIGKASTDVGVPVYVVKKADPQEPCNKSCAPGYCYCEPAQEPGFWGRVAARQASRIKQLETAAQQALGALETCDAAHISDGGRQWYDDKAVEEAITALRSALAQQAEPVEPVAWATVCDGVIDSCSLTKIAAKLKAENLRDRNRGRNFVFGVRPLSYSTQQQAEPVQKSEPQKEPNT